MLICALTLTAQNISVSSFRLLEKDLTANTAGTTEKDQNGEVAALIKVMTTQKGFIFDGGTLGIVKTVPKTAEIWVYVPRSLKKITISHPQLGTLRDYFFPLSIEAARTYELVLETGNEGKSIYGEIDISSDPAMADIYIDGALVGRTPQIVSRILPGQHEVRISLQDYKDYHSNVTVKGNETIKLSTHLDKAPPPGSKTFTIGNVEFTMILVEDGTFLMGATKEQGDDAKEDEKPVHQVTLPSYYIGETEVTQELWETVMGNNPSKFKGAKRPVERVSWKDCQKFLSKLNERTGLNFRLPTEAEWEFAARGGYKSHGYKYSGSNNIDDVAWYFDNCDKQTHEVKTKQPNELGIYDMSGNVWEFVQDYYGAYTGLAQVDPIGPLSDFFSEHVKRGGSWSDYKQKGDVRWFVSTKACRVSNRSQDSIERRKSNKGLRLALRLR
jgi:formylglycine-generating enzyme required for sulfatase activity